VENFGGQKTIFLSCLPWAIVLTHGKQPKHSASWCVAGFMMCCCELPWAHGKDAATLLRLCGTRMVWRLPHDCYIFLVSRRMGSRHMSDVHRVSRTVPWAVDLDHGKTNSPGQWTWLGHVVNVCVMCAVSHGRLLTGKSNPRYVCCVCREPSQLAHGKDRPSLCVFSAMILVNRLTAYRLGAVCVMSVVSLLGSSRQIGLYVVSPMFGSRQREGSRHPCNFR
jgi:hypothetical protein